VTQANDFEFGTETPSDGDPGTPISLSPRQRQTLSLLKAGKTNKEIAAELGIGIGTVKQHLVTLFRKLGVTNRSMAIAKSLSLQGVDIDGPTPLEDAAVGGRAVDSMLERRPVAVLSLQAMHGGADDEEAAFRDIYKIYAEVAFDFGAAFLSHRGGRCDMVFGVRRVRRHDVLRAIRAGVAVSVDLKRLKPEGPALRAGLAFGYIFASTDERGEWTGEAIGGPVISAARALLADAPAGRVMVHESARHVMRQLGVGTGGEIPSEVPLDRGFRWQRRLLAPATALHGRLVELETLRGHMIRAKSKPLNLAVVEGESGMGKSALAFALCDVAARGGVPAETWVCSIPDSQPGSPSLNRLERAGRSEVLTVAEFVRHLADADPGEPGLLVVEDTHLLRTEMFALLSAAFNQFEGSARMVLMTYRGHAPLSPVVSKSAEVLHLQHLPEEKQLDFIFELLGNGHEAADWVRRLARGVPGFIVNLTNFVKNGEARGQKGPGDVPPASLFALIAERIEAHEIDRRLLYLVARAGSQADVATLQANWVDQPSAFEPALERAVAAGVLAHHPAKRRKPGTVEIVHPLIRWVMAAAFQAQEKAFG